MNNKHIGSDFNDFLKVDPILDREIDIYLNKIYSEKRTTTKLIEETEYDFLNIKYKVLNIKYLKLLRKQFSARKKKGKRIKK